ITNGGIAYDAGAGTTVGMLVNAGGQFLQGDVAEILVYSSVADGQRASVESYLSAKYFGANPVVINQQPHSQTVNEFQPVIFTVAATGQLPLSYQWRKGGV